MLSSSLNASTTNQGFTAIGSVGDCVVGKLIITSSCELPYTVSLRQP